MTPRYLLENMPRIGNWPVQTPNEVRKEYWNSPFDMFPIIQELNNFYSTTFNKKGEPIKKISKNQIIELFKNETQYHLACTSVLVWGGINITRSKDLKNTHFYKYLSYPDQQLIDNIKILKPLLIKSKFEQAFHLYDNGSAHIPGVGQSFFPKLFYFFGQSNNEVATKPLIFDKWTQIAYFALLCDLESIGCIERQDIRERMTFVITKTNKGKDDPKIVFRNSNEQAFVYSWFVTDFNNWANELNITVSHLEEFVFGNPMMGRLNKSNYNPRFELLQKAGNCS